MTSTRLLPSVSLSPPAKEGGPACPLFCPPATTADRTKESAEAPLQVDREEGHLREDPRPAEELNGEEWPDRTRIDAADRTAARLRLLTPRS